MNGKNMIIGKRKAGYLKGLTSRNFIFPSGQQNRRLIWKVNPKILDYKELIGKIVNA